MEQFEYMIIDGYVDLNQLNDLGRLGWELVTVRDSHNLNLTADYLGFIFKRTLK